MPPRASAPLLPRPARGGGAGGGGARAHVGQRVVAPQAASRARRGAARPETRASQEEETVITRAHELDRTIAIGAPAATVFEYFTDPARWAAWWGEGSTIDARPGGRVLVKYPN